MKEEIGNANDLESTLLLPFLASFELDLFKIRGSQMLRATNIQVRGTVHGHFLCMQSED